MSLENLIEPSPANSASTRIPIAQTVEHDEKRSVETFFVKKKSQRGHLINCIHGEKQSLNELKTLLWGRVPVKGAIKRRGLGDVQVSSQMPQHRELHVGLQPDSLKAKRSLSMDFTGRL